MKFIFRSGVANRFAASSSFCSGVNKTQADLCVDWEPGWLFLLNINHTKSSFGLSEGILSTTKELRKKKPFLSAAYLDDVIKVRSDKNTK